MAVDNLRWLSATVRQVPTGTTAGVGGNGHERLQLWARATDVAQTGQVSRREREGADRIRERTWSECVDGRARTVGADCRAHAWSIALVEQFIIDLQISLHFERLHILWWKIVPPYMASIHKVHANSIKDYIETMTDFTYMPCYCYSFVIGVE